MDIKKLKKMLESMVDPDILEVLRVDVGEEWKITPETREKVKNIIEKAEKDAEVKAKTEQVYPVSKLPDDLISAAINIEMPDDDCCGFGLYGYKPLKDGVAEFFYQGKKCYADAFDALLAAMWAQGDRANGVAHITIYNNDEDRYVRRNGTRIASIEFERRWVERACWFAIVGGNAVAAESAFKKLGFVAGAGSATQVRVRELTDEEYKEATRNEPSK